MSRLKDIPELKRDLSNIQEVIQAFREGFQTFRGYRGDPLDKAVTKRDAISLGILDATGKVVIGQTGPAGPTGPAGAGYTSDYTAPPTPSGLVVTAGITYIYVSCDNPTYTQGNGHDRTVVYGAKVTNALPTPTFSDAVQLCSFQGPFGAYPTEPLTKWAIWINWRSNDGVLSVNPAGGTNGVQAQAGLSPTAMIASFGTAWIDNAMIANLSAAKLTAGDGTIGGNLKSSNYNSGVAGWLLQPGGSAEFNNVLVRGTVYATAGQIGGNTIDSTGLQSPGYVAGSNGWRFDTSGALKAAYASGTNVLNFGATGSSSVMKVGSAIDLRADGTAYFRGEINIGAYTGYAWPAAGNYGAHLGPNGLLLGNALNNRYLQVTNTGDIYTPSWNVVGGVMNLYQANVINTVNIAGQAVTVPQGVTFGVNPPATFSYIGGMNQDTGGYPVFVIVSGYVDGPAGGNRARTIYLYVNGSNVQNVTIPSYGNFTLAAYVGVPSGTFNISVYTSSGGDGVVLIGSIFSIGAKR